MAAPDLILENGRFITFDAARPFAKAVAVAGDRIVALDDLPVADARTRVVDLGGATVIPGFNDVHAHMDREGLKYQRPSLANARSVADLLAIVRQTAARTPAGAWIVTMPLGAPPFHFDGLSTIAEGRLPSRRELDEAAPDHPVYIPGLFGNWGKPPGHGMLNTLALRLNGLTRDSRPACPGIEIVRDTAGEPTGELIEHNTRPAVEFDLLPAVPRFGLTQRIDGLRLSMRLYNAVGTTSIYEGHGVAAETIAAYRTLWAEGALTVRAGLVLSPSWADVTEAKRAMRDWAAHARGSGIGDGWLRISGVHIAYGGNPVVAARARANLPDTGWSGFVEQATNPSDFREACFLCAENDVRLHTIVADQLHEIVPVLRDVNARHLIAGRRWVIEHVGRARLEDLRALRDLGVWVTTIPTYFLWKGGQAYLQDADEGESVVAHRTMLDLGLPLSIATDNIPYDPFFTLWVTTARRERTTGRTIGAGQSLDVTTALRLFTANGAQLTFDEHWKGILAPGYAADLAILSGDPTTVAPDDLRSLRCDMTIVGGRIVHDRRRDGAGPSALWSARAVAEWPGCC